jgi:hypothetical protein
MSKKERLKLRREYQEAKELDRKALADKILNAPVVNPVIKPVPEQRGLPAEKPEAGAKDACVI